MNKLNTTFYNFYFTDYLKFFKKAAENFKKNLKLLKLSNGFTDLL